MPYKDKDKEKSFQKEYRKEHKKELSMQQKTWRESNVEKLKEYFKKLYLSNRKHFIVKQRKYIGKIGKEEYNLKRLPQKRIYQKKYRQNPENYLKIKARSLTKDVIVSGLCEFCNKRLATEKHHPDYNKPLEIQFVCSPCHNQFHGYGLMEVD